MSEVVAAIAGAIVGGLIALLIAGQQIRATRMETRRQALSGAVNDLWVAADRLWEGTQEAAWVVFEIQAQRAAMQTPISPELDPMRRRALADQAAANAQARHSIARLRLAKATPDLISKADHLVKRSATFRLSVEDTTDAENRDARASALADFEKVAGPHLT